MIRGYLTGLVHPTEMVHQDSLTGGLICPTSSPRVATHMMTMVRRRDPSSRDHHPDILESEFLVSEFQQMLAALRTSSLLNLFRTTGSRATDLQSEEDLEATDQVLTATDLKNLNTNLSQPTDLLQRIIMNRTTTMLNLRKSMVQ